ncbi:MAG: patatin-like phospholipase family protein [Calditrichia bacterium]
MEQSTALQHSESLLQHEDHPKVGLALSGGAARGTAHIGILRAFRENNIPIDCLSGTSIGAVIAALYAFGVSLEDMREQAAKMSWSKISGFSIYSRGGFLTNKELGEIMQEFVGDANIEDSPIPLAIVATDISTGEKVVLRKGNLARAVMASSCIPGLYAPVEIDGRKLVDGFLVENVPISPLPQMGAEVVIGVNLGKRRTYRKADGIFNVVMNAFEIAIDENTNRTLKMADALIEPIVKHIPEDDENYQSIVYDAGYGTALINMQAIRAAIKKKRRQIKRGLWQRIREFFGLG